MINQVRGVLEIEGSASKALVLPSKALNIVKKGKNNFKYDYPFPKMGGNGYDLHAELASQIGIYVPSHWYPGSRKNAVHSLTYKITVKTHSPWIGIVPGTISNEKNENGIYSATFTQEKEADSISLSAGAFVFQQSSYKDVTFRVYLPNHLTKMLPPYVQATKMYLISYEKMIGDFAYPYYAAISSPVPARSRNSPGFTLLDISQLLDSKFVLGTFSHEILHNYWGAVINGPLNFANWVEGLTTYMSEYVFLKKHMPDVAHEKLIHWQEKVEKAEAVSVLKFKGHSETELQVIGYYKVALVFHMLRQRLGEEVFSKVMRRIWASFKFKVVMWSDFERFFSEESGKDVSPFFDVWVRGKKKPTMQDLRQTALNMGS